MTYQSEFGIKFADSAAIGAFGRLRVGEPFIIFDSKQLFDDQPFIWATKTVSGSTATHNINRASSLLTVTTSSGSMAVRQSKRRAFYQPGKSLQIMATAVLGQTETGVRKRVGLFDEKNGIFFEQDGQTSSFVVRSFVSGIVAETRVPQASWNVDVLNGSGSSTVSLNPAAAQIFFFDLEWLGIGRVRTGFVFNGQIRYAHEFNFANITDSVYMSTPNLPMRYEIDNVSGSSATDSIEQICSTITSEGGLQPAGQIRSVDRGKNFFDVPSGSLVPLISLRLNSGCQGTSIIPTDINVLALEGTDFRWALILNPTFGGTDAASWSTVTGSCVQYDINRDITNTITGGFVIQSGYAQSLKGLGAGSNIASFNLFSDVILGTDVDDVSDELVLAMEHFTASPRQTVASLSWRELI